MKNEQLKKEIDRLRNFRSGLEKQVEHYNELLREMLTEYAINEAKYRVGNIIVYSFNGYKHTGIVKSMTADFFGENKIDIKYHVENSENGRDESIYETGYIKLIGSTESTNN